MINSFSGMNISSKDPKRLVLFYKETLGIPVLEDDANYDGVVFGFIKDAPVFWIWDENKWGKANTGTVTLVFNCDDHDKTYDETFEKKEKRVPGCTKRKSFRSSLFQLGVRIKKVSKFVL